MWHAFSLCCLLHDPLAARFAASGRASIVSKPKSKYNASRPLRAGGAPTIYDSIL
jgi:hypothetical protein